MPSSLTSTKIKDTYGQVLHVDGGVTSTPKLVYDGDGTATALKVSTTDVQVNNSPVLTDADLPSLATAAQGAKADTAVQPAAIANMLETSDIGVSVQAYDADLTAWSGKTAPSGTVVGTSDSQALSNKTFSDNPVFSAGTANGVAYLNGSKVLTTGSALTFDGTTLSSTKFAGALNGTVGATTPAAGTFTSLSDSGNLTFTGTGNRITGDFSNATLANRVVFQTSTTNGNTTVGAIPNGTATTSQFIAHSGTDMDNTSRAGFNTSNTQAIFFADKTGTGTYLPMTFYTGGSERMRIDTSGNLGIGTSSPAANLDVIGVVRTAQSNTSDAYFRAQNSFGSLFLLQKSDRAAIYTGTSQPLVFDIAGERMRIDSSGNLLVGCTSFPNTGIKGFGVFANTNFALGRFSTIDTTATALIDFFNPNGKVGQISTSGTTTAYSTSSDHRLKENIQPMQNALDVVAQLNPVTYTWKADGSDGQGFIAHELQAVVPDCVTGEKDAVDEEGKPVYQGIDTSFLVGILTKAIQELKAELDATKAEVTALKAIN